jgi:heme exporter protein A
MGDRWAIQASGLGRIYGDTVALRGVNLDIAWGERIALMGPNGAGKTTLLKLLALLLRPTGGMLRVAGYTLESAGTPLRALVGYHGHHSAVYPDLTVVENLTFFAGLYRLDASGERIDTSLERFGLSGRRHQRAATLSRGLQQRVGLARALLHDPPILLLDEPDTSLDASGQEVLASLLSAPGRTVVLSTHDASWGRQVCERVVLLDGGRIAQDIAPIGGRLDADRQERAPVGRSQ